MGKHNPKQEETPKMSTIQEALNNAQTIEECMSNSEYFIKVAFSFMRKAEQIQMSQDKSKLEKVS
jgi:hypothetical protein